MTAREYLISFLRKIIINHDESDLVINDTSEEKDEYTNYVKGVIIEVINQNYGEIPLYSDSNLMLELFCLELACKDHNQLLNLRRRLLDLLTNNSNFDFFSSYNDFKSVLEQEMLRQNIIVPS